MIRYFIEHPTAGNIFMMILLLMGWVALPTLNRETFPHVERFEVTVKVAYPGASASDVEEGICLPLEDGTDGIRFLSEKRCDARNSLATMTLKMKESGDMVQFLSDIKDRVEQVQDFPDDAETPTVSEAGLTSSVISMALTGPMSNDHLKRFAQQLKDQLLLNPLINLVDIKGFSQAVININVSAERLQMHNISISQIAQIISRQNTDSPAGDIQTLDKNYAIRVSDLRRTPQQLAQLVIIRNEGGSELTLGEIAHIQLDFENQDQQIWFNGQSAALLTIKKNTQDDGIKIKQAVQQFIEHTQPMLPRGVNLTLTQDMVSIAQDRLDLLLNNGAQGLVLVFLAMWLFFSLKYSFWVAMGLPISFMASFMVMTWVGISINMISMVAMLIALGILMDDAIVLSESIATHIQKARQKGESVHEAVWHGVEKVKRGVFSSFITTVLVFGSLVFIEGDMGQILRVLPIVLISVISVSLIEAFLILPHHLANSSDKPSRFKHINAFKDRFEQLFEKLRLKVYAVAKVAVVYRYASFGLAIFIFIFSISLLASGVVKFQAFPSIEGDIIQARIIMPQGTPIQHTQALVARMELAIKQVDEQLLSQGQEQVALIKNIQSQFGSNKDAFENGPHLATISVDLTPSQQRNIRLIDLMNLWQQQVGPVASAIQVQFKEPTLGPSGRAIEIRLSGHDLAQINRASLTLQNKLADYAGVYSLQSDLRPGKPEYSLTLKPGAYSLGIDASDIASQFRAALSGVKVSNVRLGDQAVDVVVKYHPDSRDSLQDLDDFKVVNESNGSQIPLAVVANVSEQRSWSRIHRINQQKTVTIYGDIDTQLANTQEVFAHFKQSALPALQKQFPAVHFNFEGEVKNSAQTGGSILQGFILSLLGIYFLLSLQFKNYLEPVIVMTAIPLSLIGVILGHLVMGLPITMPSMMGFVSLAGIVVNNSILLVEFIKFRVSEGHAIHDAAALASKDRFRAIFITTLTTLAGMMPLLFETSLQAQVLVPLVCSIVFGLMSSTLLVLFVVPALFSILEDMGFKEPQETEPLASQPLDNEN